MKYVGHKKKKRKGKFYTPALLLMCLFFFVVVALVSTRKYFQQNTGNEKQIKTVGEITIGVLENGTWERSL